MGGRETKGDWLCKLTGITVVPAWKQSAKGAMHALPAICVNLALNGVVKIVSIASRTLPPFSREGQIPQF